MVAIIGLKKPGTQIYIKRLVRFKEYEMASSKSSYGLSHEK
jgi:hypothetical protein